MAQPSFLLVDYPGYGDNRLLAACGFNLQDVSCAVDGMEEAQTSEIFRDNGMVLPDGTMGPHCSKNFFSRECSSAKTFTWCNPNDLKRHHGCIGESHLVFQTFHWFSDT